MIASRKSYPPVFALLLLGALGIGAGATHAQPRQVPVYTIEQFMETVRICCASFSPDGEKLLFTSDASGVFNASRSGPWTGS